MSGDEIPVKYFLVDKGRVSLLSIIKVPRDAEVYKLRDAIDAIEVQRGLLGRVRLWKPHEFLPGMDGQTRLASRFQEAKGVLARFCEDLSDEEQLLKLVADLLQVGGSGSRGGPRLAKATALVAEVVEPISTQSHAEGDEGDGDEATDTLTELKKNFTAVIKEGCKLTPSVSSQPVNYKNIQSGAAPILDGRYGLQPNPIGVPVEIIHPAFAQFRALAADMSVQLPEDIVRLTAQLMVSASQISTIEAPRQEFTRGILTKLLSYGFTQTVNLNKTSSDHTCLYNRTEEPLGVAAPGVVEEKAEMGTSGEASVQGSFSFLQHWTDPNNKALTMACCCPSFIISISGPWVVVLGAVITSHVVVHRLTDYIWLGNSRAIDDDHAFRVARVFNALRLSMHRLRKYYETLSPPEDPNSRFFPLATSYVTDENGVSNMAHFRYIRPLKGSDPSCVAFLASDVDDKDRLLVVKFVERYGEGAHRLLMAQRMAPRLLYCGEVWQDGPERHGCLPRKMVVMEYMPGRTALDGVSVSVRQTVRDALGVLHGLGFVHGDIRRPNILIADGDGDEGKRTMILDFDWAGKEGEARYPLHLSDIRWPDGVEDYALIEKEHDCRMVDFL
ncbi:proteinkinasesubdomain-containingproteinPKL/ccin9 [Moniliophthora roreri]|nr:proteinkinasesubdomain-containingproteinPKL/ccin9 [Moniliophthora roreri]